MARKPDTDDRSVKAKRYRFKLTPAQHQQVCFGLRDGLSVAHFAQLFGVSRSTIVRVRKRGCTLLRLHDISRKALAMLRHQNALLRMVDKSGSVLSTNGAKIADTLKIRIPTSFTVSTKARYDAS